MTTWMEAALERRNEHVAAGLGEAEPLTVLDRHAELALVARLDAIIAEGQYEGGFMGRGTYGDSPNRTSGYLQGRN